MTGRFAEAEASYKRMLEIHEQLVREKPAEAAYSVGIARALYHLGHVQRMTGRWMDAQASYQRTSEIYENIVRENPSVASYRMDAARAYYHFGLVQCISGQRDQAIHSWAAAATSYAATADLGYTTLQVFTGLGDSFAMLDKWQEASDAFAKGVDASDHDLQPLCQLALLRWAAGDVAGYRAACADLLSRHGDTAKGAQAVAIAMACTAGPDAVDDLNSVLVIIQRTAATDPQNPVLQTLVGAVQFRAGQTQEAIQTLNKSMPMHDLAASKQLDQIRISQLTGETILALAYHEAKDEQAQAKQLDVLRGRIEQVEATTPQYSEGLGPWALPLAILCAKRDLARLDADRSK
jgi:tetratricopeptide (TPR) repeat protein